MGVKINTSKNTFITGGTFSATTLTLDRNDGNDVVITGFTSGGGSDVFITGGTFSASTLTLDKNDGNNVTVTGFTSNGYINGALVNPTSYAWSNTAQGLGADRMVAIVYSINKKLPIDGLTITTTASPGGYLTVAIYKYNELTGVCDKIVNTEVNTFNTSLAGFQTVSITPTTLEPGIYMNVLHADSTYTQFGGLQQPKLDPPLGRVAATGVIKVGLIRYGYTYAHPMPASIAPDASFGFSIGTNYYGKYASFLLNQV